MFSVETIETLIFTSAPLCFKVESQVPDEDHVGERTSSRTRPDPRSAAWMWHLVIPEITVLFAASQ